MKFVQKMPSIHIPIQKPDGSMEWVWYMFLQWLSEHLEEADLSNYFTKEETNALLSAYYTKTETDDILSGYAIDSNVVHKTGTESIAGYKTFTDPTTTVCLTVNPLNDSPTNPEGGEIRFVGASGEVNAGKLMFIGRHNGRLRLFGYDSSATVHVQLEADAEHNALYGVAPTEDTTSSRQIDTVGARNTKLQSYQPLLTAGSNITISGNTISATDTTYSVMTGATSSAAGTSGLVPAPASGDNDKFLKGDGTWGTVASGNYHPDLFDTKWSDHIVNDIQWLRGDTFSWQSGYVYEAAYDHLVDDIDGKSLTSETVGSTTVQFYLADDGHKICPATQENNVASIYAATGVAWYYILDTANTRFKLPRAKHNKYADNLSVVGDGTQLHVRNNGDGNVYAVTTSDRSYSVGDLKSAPLATPTDGSTLGMGANTSVGLALSGSGVIAQQTEDTGQYKYLYFYVGNFTQTALENTAGLNASLFNGKADTDLNNVAAGIDFVVESQLPNAGNNYTWYRKYKSGWVEQGGTFATVNSNYHTESVVLPIPMNDENYTLNITSSAWGSVYAPVISVKTSTGFTTPNIVNAQAYSAGWQVSGMAA